MLIGVEIEQTYIDIVRAVKSSVSIPVAVKISPFFSNMANMAKRLDDAGANGLVLFNRFYQPDIDLEELEIRPNVLLSTPQAFASAADVDRDSVWPVQGQPGGHQRYSQRGRRHQDVDGRSQCNHVVFVLLRNGIDHLRMIERGCASGWKSTNTNRCTRCRAA